MRTVDFVSFLLLHLLSAWSDHAFVSALPNRFIAEVVTDVRSIKGTFAPNPRKGDKPMLLLISKEGQVQAVEDPDNSPHAITILDLAEHICTNEERGLQNILVPTTDGSSNSTFVYLYYSTRVGDCSATDEPWNVVAKFEMNPTTLKLDFETRTEIWRGTPSLSGNHNGGGLVHGNDGKLYITTGDGGRRRNANDLTNLHGKIIRLNMDGSIPDDNPFIDRAESYNCAQHSGRVPDNVTAVDAVCSEIFSYGLRNPFRVTVDPNETNKTKLIISEVGTATWEELNPAGSDYAGVSYGFPSREGPCRYQSTTNCEVPENDEFGNRIVDPLHFYLHHKDGNAEGAAVSAAAFVPKSIGWPSEYEFMMSDFIFQEIYSLTEDSNVECKECVPPVSRYTNTTFFRSNANPGDDYSAPRIVDMFFGPYQDTQALYVVRFGSAYQNFDTILRIRYTDNDNNPPVAVLDVEGNQYSIGSEVQFSGLQSSDPEGEALSFRWYFGDGEESRASAPVHIYNKEGHYKVTMIVTDSSDQSQQQTVTVTVGDPPIPSIISPPEGKLFSVGEILQLSGSASYSNGTIMDESLLEWSARRHHATHYHPFLGKRIGNETILYPAPPPEDFFSTTNSYLEILLTVKDPATGLSSTSSRVVMPRMVNLTFDTEPSGLQMLVDGQTLQTPRTIVSWTDHTLGVQVFDQNNFQFSQWSDGRDFQHTIIVPQDDETYLASFESICINSLFDLRPSVMIIPDESYGPNQYYCFGDSLKFGINGAGVFGLYVNFELVWKPINDNDKRAQNWMFTSDGNLVITLQDESTLFASEWDPSFQRFTGSEMNMDGSGVQISKDDIILWQLDAESLKTQKSEMSLQCVTPISSQWVVPAGDLYESGDALCLRDGYKFGIDQEGQFGFFDGSELLWSPSSELASKWIWQNDGNLVVYSSFSTVVWASMGGGNYRDADDSDLMISTEGLTIQKDGTVLWNLRFQDSCLLTSYNINALVVPAGRRHKQREFYCIQHKGTTRKFGIDENGVFGYFLDGENIWKPDNMRRDTASSWRFQSDGNLVVHSGSEVVYAWSWENQNSLLAGSVFEISANGLAVLNNDTVLWNIDSDMQMGQFSEGTCMNEAVAFDSSILFIPVEKQFERGYFHCLRGETYRFGLDEQGNFGYFVNSELVWEPSNRKSGIADYWIFQDDGNLVLRSGDEAVWASNWEVATQQNSTENELLISPGGASIVGDGAILWTVNLRDASSTPVERERMDSPGVLGRSSLRGRGNPL